MKYYLKIQSIIILYFFSLSHATLVKGYVVDENKNPISNANIVLLDSNYGVQSNSEGSFIFEDLQDSLYKMLVTYIGYEDVTQNIYPLEDNSVFIQMKATPIDFKRIVVTGTRVEQHIKDSPVLTHIISQNDISNSIYSNIKDMMQLAIPNMQSVPSSHTGERLKSQGLDNKYMLFLIDGDRVSGEYAGNLDFSMLNIANVEKIEVVESSLSTLYGSSAIGGVVNIITKLPKDKFWLNYSKSYDEVLNINQFYNIGINREKVFYDFNYFINDFGGFDLTPNNETGDAEMVTNITLVESHDKSYQHRIKYQLNQKSKLELSFKDYYKKIIDYMEQYYATQGGDVAHYAEPLKRYRDITTKIKYESQISNNEQLKMVFLNEEYKKINYYPYYYNDTSVFDVINGKEFESANVIHRNIYAQYNNRFEKNNLLIGLEHNEDYYSTYNIYDSSGELLAPSIFNAENYTYSYNNSSFFIHNHYKHSKENEISFGLRYTNSSFFENKFIYSFSHMMKRKSGYNVRVTIASGYKLPSVKELYYEYPSHTPPLYGNINLLPTTNKKYIISFDKREENNDFSAILYINNIKNYITTSSELFEGVNSLIYRNYDNVIINGFNLHYLRYLNKDMSIKFVYNYTDVNNVESDEILELVGKHALRVKYSQRMSEKLKFVADIRYMGEKFNNRQEASVENAIIKLDSYWLTDIAFVATNIGLANIKVGIKNLFDYTDPHRFGDLDILSSYDPGRRYYFEASINYKRN